MSLQASKFYKEHIENIYASLHKLSMRMSAELGAKNAQLLSSNSHNFYNANNLAIVIQPTHKGINKLHSSLIQESKDIISFNDTIYNWVNTMNTIANYFVLQDMREVYYQILPQDLLELLQKQYPNTKNYVWTTSHSVEEVIAKQQEYINMYDSFLLIHFGEDQ